MRALFEGILVALSEGILEDSGYIIIFPFISNIFLQSLGVKEVNKVVQIYTCKKQQSVSQKPHKQCDLRRTGKAPRAHKHHGDGS